MEEVQARTLPDLIVPGLDILIVGINPGLISAYSQHYYSGPGNHFWQCMSLSGLLPSPMEATSDRTLLGLGIGFTNVVERTTSGIGELRRAEMLEGAEKLRLKLQQYNPKIAVFNGKTIYEVFSGEKNVIFGLQPQLVEGTNTRLFVMPSSSARCSQLPRAVDKLPFYVALRKLRDHVKGDQLEMTVEELTFPNLKLKTAKKTNQTEERGLKLKHPPTGLTLVQKLLRSKYYRPKN